ncbi:hypothetical protein H2203_004964 [Taxawa tesnikishii (nom. ined.)]|nr:hypothetical protein H2203_004964 [Dothideales sp. JES 119]
MSARQSLLAIGPGRPFQYRLIRINGVRYRSQINLPNRQRAAEKGTNTPHEEPIPYNSSNFGRSRQRRAAQVSQEVQMLNRGTPSGPKVAGSNSPYPRIRSRGVDAEDAGYTRSSGQMGANFSSGREGPNAQGVGRPLRAGFASDESRSERGTVGRVEDPAEGGVSLMEATRDMEGQDLNEEEEFDEDEDEDEDDDESGPSGYSTLQELQMLEQFDKEEITAVPFDPEPVTREEYLQLGQGGATIAGGNYEGVVADRLKLLAEQIQDDFRYAPDIAKRMMKGEFISFKDEDEKAAVLAAAAIYAENNASKIAEQRGGEEEVEKFEHDFAPVSAQTQNATFDKLVRGTYGDLHANPHKHEVLNQIARSTLRNSSYLAADGAKLLKKVSSLLPSQAAARPAARQGRPAPRK